MIALNMSLSELNLVKIRGKITYTKQIKSITWLRVGGAAEVFFQPSDLGDLCEFVSLLPRTINITPIGVCSNLLVRDGGIPGVTIKLGKGFSEIYFDGPYVTVGGAVLDSHLAEVSAQMGIDLSFLRTIPGTIGGAVKMNAGCYGRSLEDIFVSCEVVRRSGEVDVLTGTDLQFSYRYSNLLDDTIVTSVKLKGKKENPEYIKTLMKKNQKTRIESQPIREKTGGSTFKNPKIVDQTSGIMMSAWQLIDKVNLRGQRLGGAQVSKIHPNFLINIDNAEAEDFELLGELIQKRVYLDSGINLEWEIKKIGLRKDIAKQNSVLNMDLGCATKK